MDFGLSEPQVELRASAIEFARSELGGRLEQRDLDCAFSREDWQKCARFGVQGMAVPEAYGGRGKDLMSNFLMMEGLGYGCRDNGLTFALNAQFVGVVTTLLEAGDEAQKQRYLRGVCDGSLIGAHAMTEPEAGSDAFSLTTRFERVADGYVLNGHKCFITLAPTADFFLVFATDAPELGHWGVSLFVVDRETPGLETTGAQSKMGLRTTPMGELRLQNCQVGEEALIGEEGSGAAIFNAGQDMERAAILASQIGAMDYQLERAIEYARSREQFGQPIGNFQSVSNRIAEMKVRLEASRLLAYKAVWSIVQREPSTMNAAIANYVLAESFVQSSLDAIMIHGGRGYLTEHGVERDLRDAVGGPLYGGTSDIQRNIIARQLGL